MFWYEWRDMRQGEPLLITRRILSSVFRPFSPQKQFLPGLRFPLSGAWLHLRITTAIAAAATITAPSRDSNPARGHQRTGSAVVCYVEFLACHRGHAAGRQGEAEDHVGYGVEDHVAGYSVDAVAGVGVADAVNSLNAALEDDEEGCRKSCSVSN